MRPAATFAPLVAVLALVGCGGDAGSWGSFTDSSGPCLDGGCTTDGGTNDTGAPEPTTSPPPEQEEDLLLFPPAQTDVYVFVANPERDTVTRVDARTLAVETTLVGSGPRLVLTTPDHGTAVVFNAGDDSVSLLDAATLEQRAVDVRDNLNTMVLSPDGAWAVLWHAAARVDPDDPPPDGLQSFNECSFVHLPTGEHRPLAVGFNPRMVRFTPDGGLAVVVSDDVLAVVDLRREVLSPDLVELAPGDLDPPAAEEVVLAPDGSFAWVRQFGATELLVVDLATGGVAAVAAGDNPTDLDLSPDGTQAVAVARGSSELWVYRADAPTAAPRRVPLPPEGSYGSLVFDPTGRRAVLYTTASAVERYATWTPATDAVVERSLVKPVRSVAVSPTGDTLLVFHTETDGPSTESLFAGQWAMTLVDLADGRTNTMHLPAEPLGYANATSGELGYMVMDGEQFFEVLDYRTLLHDQYTLRSPPVFLGVLPDPDTTDADEPPAWVSQEYPLGRISFFDADDGSFDTLTGFELNSEIEVEE